MAGRVGAVVVALLGVLAVMAPAASALPASFTERVVLTGLTQPTSVAFAADGRVFVSEKSGLIQVFDSLSDPTPTRFADLRTNVHNFWDRGLSALTLDPLFPTRPYVYVTYTYDAPIGGTAPRWGTAGATSDGCPTPPGANTDGCVVSGRISRLEISPANTMVGPELVLVNAWCQQFPSHTNDDVLFGRDGALYASAGDGASFNTLDWGQLGGGAGSPTPANPCGDPAPALDRFGVAGAPPTAEGGSLRAQDLRTSGDPVALNGSLIRIDPNTGAGLPNNPLAGSADANARRIVAHGFRNPFRLAQRPGTDEIWVADVGDTRWEEINRVVAPTAAVQNHGWPCYEGAPRQPNWDFNGLNICENLYTAGGVTAPVLAYQHNANPVVPGDTCTDVTQASLSGLAFYSGNRYPAAYAGALFFADYTRDCMWVIRAGADGVPDPALRQPFHPSAVNPVDLEIGPGGDLFYVDFDGGTVRRIEYSTGNRAPTADATATPSSGPVPLTVQFDGGGSSDPDGDALTYAWDLDGDGDFDDGMTAQVARTYTVGGAVTATLRVRDPAGLTATDVVVVTPGNTPPRPAIAAPLATARWGVGDTITFSGSADDTESGMLGASALRWTLILHHCITPTECHQHSVQDYVGVAGGSVVAPDHEYPSYLEFRLTATDPGGLQATTSVQIEAAPVQLQFLCVPTGLTLSVGSQVAATPFTYTAIRGATTAIAAATQSLGGQTYAFRSWSDGGAAGHAVNPTTDSTYTATFDAVASTTIAADSFARTVADGWGSAATGGAYTLVGTPANFDVNGAQGTIALPTPGSSRGAQLPGATGLDVDLAVTLRTDKAATGSGQYVYAATRRQASGAEYRSAVKLMPGGGAQVQLSRLAGSTETAIGSPVTVSGLTVTPGTPLRLRTQVTGTNPTTLRVRVWPASGAEPATWHLTATDATTGLQTAGSLALRAYISSSTTNAPVLVTLDDLLATAGAPPPEPPVTTLVTDAFGRLVTDGWGSATTGGAYALSGTAANFDVNGTQGTILLPTASAIRIATLPASGRDVDVSVAVRTDKVATGSGQYVYALSRRQPSGAEYRTMLKLAAGGVVQVQAARIDGGGAEVGIGSAATIAGLMRTTATTVRLRTQVVGANPTTIRVRAWDASQPEPATWNVTVTDSTAALQTAGTLGLRAYISSSTSNAPVLVTVDDYGVTVP